jgi:hypothetical protein
MRAEMLTQWLAAAEREGCIPRLHGGLWHPYRRDWATERIHLPLKALADAAGWQDSATLSTGYQQTDDAKLLEVMNAGPVLSSRGQSGSRVT